ncbi:MAG: sodium:proton antiporter [Propionibacteriaceae bacterium]|nr:sodium:proton antiporter [Propionibacteriaceae bacterium]
MDVPGWGLVPFVVMLLAIAIAPMIPALAHHWERNGVKLAAALVLGVPTAAWTCLSGGTSLVGHALGEYVQFIALLASLYVISGGIHLSGDLRATPRTNTILLGIGGLIASFIGTTGAAMLLVRPLLATNRERALKAHTFIFTILIVANCGGLLTPLGDPPLYIGMLRGVPFAWTFTLWGPWLFTCGLLLFTYYALDRRAYAREHPSAIAWDDTDRTPLRLHGGANFIWLAVIVASVALLGDHPVIKVVVQLAAAGASYLIGDRDVRLRLNGFTWAPILEVAALFIGIFLTMVPALEFLRLHAHALPLNQFSLFAASGVLSGVLDNAPTYLTFFEMSTQLTLPGHAVVAGVPVLYLEAISLGAVTFGALTYIGNGPNFMVRSIAERAGVRMPSFGGYIGWAVRYLVPVLVSMACVFLAQEWIVRGVGLLIALAVVGRDVVMIARNRDPHTVPVP